MSEYFARVANDVLKASEELSVIMEDGLSAMLRGEQASSSSSSGGGGEAMPTSAAEDSSFGDDYFDDVMEDELVNSPLEGIAESLLGDLMQNSAKPQGIVENIQAFSSAITWSEPFIIGLLVFQIVLFGLSIAVSRPHVGLVPRLSLMIFIAGVVRTAEHWNAYANEHWEAIGCTQNYFDRQGVFVAIMVSSPLLMDCLMMLLLFVREAAQLLVAVKTNELKRKRKTQQQETNKGKKESVKKEQ